MFMMVCLVVLPHWASQQPSLSCSLSLALSSNRSEKDGETTHVSHSRTANRAVTYGDMLRGTRWGGGGGGGDRRKQRRATAQSTKACWVAAAAAAAESKLVSQSVNEGKRINCESVRERDRDGR
uniref:Putative secreted protein n=1 Tax=Anopheles darlingi TaxID=43151 RepID=A0A2M4DIR4_ANODA